MQLIIQKKRYLVSSYRESQIMWAANFVLMIELQVQILPLYTLLSKFEEVSIDVTIQSLCLSMDTMIAVLYPHCILIVSSLCP